MLRKMNASDEQIEEVCRKYWQSSSVRKYYVELCMNRKDYDRALQVLDESLNLDNQYNIFNIKAGENYGKSGNG